MYKYTVYMYTCSSLSFIHAYTVGQPIPRSHLADVIPTQALQTLRSPRDTKGAGKAVPQRTFRRAFSPVDLTFLRASRERGEREIGGVIMMRGYVCERKLLADAKIR